jgi:transcriptional regulator with XRE-family HTH domain
MLTNRQIRRIRSGLGLTQGQVASLLGVHPLTVSKWERGLLAPSSHQEALLRSFKKATSEPDIGATIGDLLVTAGAIVALFALLKAALDE